MADKHPIRTKVIAGVITSLVVAILAGFWRSLPDVYHAIVSLLQWCRSRLHDQVSLPLGVLLVFSVNAFISIMVLAICIIKRLSHKRGQITLELSVQGLTDLEETIMKMLAGLDDNSLWP